MDEIVVSKSGLTQVKKRERKKIMKTTHERLLRNFVANRLRGYFAREKPVILPSVAGPLPFGEMVGEADYRKHVAKIYASGHQSDGDSSGGGGLWTTPSEIFRPWYTLKNRASHGEWIAGDNLKEI